MSTAKRPPSASASRLGVSGAGALPKAVPSKASSSLPSSSSAPSVPKETPHEKAAAALLAADFVLIAGGAGFSADSGLPVYKDIANVPAYHRMKVTYADLCDPQWLENDPEIFFGFWGSCFNSYKDTPPHSGYQLIQKWKRFFESKQQLPPSAVTALRSSASASGVASQRPKSAAAAPSSRIAASPAKSRPSTSAASASSRPKAAKAASVVAAEQSCNPNELPPSTHPMFVYTSNVDTAFTRSGFPPNHVFEIHGNIDTWQCGLPCCAATWTISPDYRFEINEKTMRAPRHKALTAAEKQEQEEQQLVLPDISAPSVPNFDQNRAALAASVSSLSLGASSSSLSIDSFVHSSPYNAPVAPIKSPSKKVVPKSPQKHPHHGDANPDGNRYHVFIDPYAVRKTKSTPRYFFPGMGSSSTPGAASVASFSSATVSTPIAPSVLHAPSIQPPSSPISSSLSSNIPRSPPSSWAAAVSSHMPPSSPSKSSSGSLSSPSSLLSPSSLFAGIDTSIALPLFSIQDDLVRFTCCSVDPSIYKPTASSSPALFSHQDIFSIQIAVFSPQSSSASHPSEPIPIHTPVSSGESGKVSSFSTRTRASDGMQVHATILDASLSPLSSPAPLVIGQKKITLPTEGKIRISLDRQHPVEFHGVPPRVDKVILQGSYFIPTAAASSSSSFVPENASAAKREVDLAVAFKTGHRVLLKLQRLTSQLWTLTNVCVEVPVVPPPPIAHRPASASASHRSVSASSSSSSSSSLLAPELSVANAPRPVSASASRPLSAAASRRPAVPQTPTNFIVCKSCNRLARPNILMFDDVDWIPIAEKSFNNWEKRVKKILKTDLNKKLVILEAGCGLRVPTVRNNSERMLKEIRKAGGNCTLIRINPENPENRDMPQYTISIRDTCLAALRSIDSLIDTRLVESGLQNLLISKQ